MQDTPLILGEQSFLSRLLIGSANYKDESTLINCIATSEAEIITVSMRRIGTGRSIVEDMLKPFKGKIKILPNTAGCYTAKEAILTARLAREALGTPWIKLEVIGDDKTLFPDVVELLKAAEELLKEDFIVLPYCNDDLVTCQKLADMGCAAIMPLGAPIGSGMGILNPYNLKIIREKINIPIILDAGIGTSSDVVMAMELGLDGVLINTAIAEAEDSVGMAQAMKLACQSGRLAYLSGRIPTKFYATSSSPLVGIIYR